MLPFQKRIEWFNHSWCNPGQSSNDNYGMTTFVTVCFFILRQSLSIEAFLSRSNKHNWLLRCLVYWCFVARKKEEQFNSRCRWLRTKHSALIDGLCSTWKYTDFLKDHWKWNKLLAEDLVRKYTYSIQTLNGWSSCPKVLFTNCGINPVTTWWLWFLAFVSSSPVTVVSHSLWVFQGTRSWGIILVGYRKQGFITCFFKLEYSKWRIYYFPLFFHYIFTFTQKYGRMKKFHCSFSNLKNRKKIILFMFLRLCKRWILFECWTAARLGSKPINLDCFDPSKSLHFDYKT